MIKNCSAGLIPMSALAAPVALLSLPQILVLVGHAPAKQANDGTS
jgi:hypothetical protein